jgi:hypothetical protein
VLLLIKEQQRYTIFAIAYHSNGKSERTGEILNLSFEVDVLSILECLGIVGVKSGESAPFCGIKVSCLSETDVAVFFRQRHKLDVFAFDECTCLDEFVLSVDCLDHTAVFACLDISHKHFRVVDFSELVSLFVDVNLSVEDLFELLELIFLLLVGELVMLMKIFFEKLVVFFGNRGSIE